MYNLHNIQSFYIAFQSNYERNLNKFMPTPVKKLLVTFAAITHVQPKHPVRQE